MKKNLTWALIGALLAGILCGFIFKEKAAVLGLPGKIFIQLITAVATPLLFFAILESFLKINIRGRDFLQMLKIFGINASAALTIALLYSNFFKPGLYLDLRSWVTSGEQQLPNPSISKMIEKMMPTSFVGPFSENNIFSIVILAVLLGFALRSLRKDNTSKWSALISSLSEWAGLGFHLMEKILHWLTYLVPLAVFGVTAKAVGEKGLGIFGGMMAYLAICLAGLLTQMLIIYHAWIIFYLKISIKKFWIHSKEALIYAFGVNSSLATIHLSLKAAEKLGATPHNARMVVCIGSNLNNDGILLYEAAAALFITQALGIPLDLGSQLLIALTCILATLGVSGIPEAGIISLSIVLTANHLPAETIPILLSVDWLIARMRSSTNVMSDIVGSLILDKKLKAMKSL